jgi:hypothetical protein
MELSLRRSAVELALALALASTLDIDSAPATQPVAIARTSNAVTDLAHCLAARADGGDGNEAVLLESGWVCAEHHTGSALVGGTIAALDPAEFCSSRHATDPRRLPSETIKRIAEQKETPLAPTGIRIIGAVFCRDEVNLSDLDLPYPLVLDRGLFRFGIRAQNFRTRGNFSVEDSLVFDNLTLSGSHIAGSVYGRRSFIRDLKLLDTEVRGSAHLNGSLLIGSTVFDRLTLLGDLDLDESPLSRLSVLRSKIDGQLDLSRAEARCGYEVSNSTIGDLLASDMGLGATSPAPGTAASGANAARWFAWSQEVDSNLKPLAENPAVNKLIGSAEPCPNQDPEILLNGSTIQSVCLQAIHWLVPHDTGQPPTSYLTFSDITTTGNMYVDLWPSARGKSDGVAADRHVFQLVGITAGTFIFDFQDVNRPFRTIVDRIRFDRVEASNIDCDAQPRGSNWHLPSTRELEKWFDLNSAPVTTLSIATFIDAFTRSGVDATDLKVIKAKKDLLGNASAKWHQFVSVMQSGDWQEILGYVFSLNRLIEVVGLSLSFVAGAVADFGFRPYKSLIYVAIALLLVNAFIVIGLKVTHARSAAENRQFRIGPYFLLDRMVPGYDFDPAHFKVSEYLLANGQPSDEKTKKYVEWALLFIKLFGILAAVFIAASLKAIIPG